jgi:membrane associated rhomboid family serine protease
VFLFGSVSCAGFTIVNKLFRKGAILPIGIVFTAYYAVPVPKLRGLAGLSLQSTAKGFLSDILHQAKSSLYKTKRIKFERFTVSQPRAINAPRVVLVSIAVLVALYALQSFGGQGVEIAALQNFAFIPYRYVLVASGEVSFDGPAFWTPISYALMHGSWTHVLMNSVWLLVFGAPLAWRLGAMRFLVFSAITAALAAFTHMAIEPQSLVPLVGASGAISAHTAAALRFAFRSDMSVRSLPPERRYNLPALSFPQMLQDKTVSFFLLFWVVSNVMFIGSDSNTAWFAHLGGFFAGLALFPLFDDFKRKAPYPPENPDGDEDDTPPPSNPSNPWA